MREDHLKDISMGDLVLVRWTAEDWHWHNFVSCDRGLVTILCEDGQFHTVVEVAVYDWLPAEPVEIMPGRYERCPKCREWWSDGFVADVPHGGELRCVCGFYGVGT